LNTIRASNTGRGSDVIVLIEAGGFYSRKYGNTTKANNTRAKTEKHKMLNLNKHKLNFKL